MSRNIIFIFIFVVLGLFPGISSAGEPRLLDTSGDWDAYVFLENGNKVCYMASKPKKSEGAYTKRGDIFALITHRPAEGTKNVFSYITGYTYKTGSDTTLAVGGDKFVLFTQDDTAWAPDAATDERLVKAVRSGSKMIVRGTSSRGTDTKDVFSLKGSAGAHDLITRECGYN